LSSSLLSSPNALCGCELQKIGIDTIDIRLPDLSQVDEWSTFVASYKKLVFPNEEFKFLLGYINYDINNERNGQFLTFITTNDEDRY
jgi:hypothetical protein